MAKTSLIRSAEELNKLFGLSPEIETENTTDEALIQGLTKASALIRYEDEIDDDGTIIPADVFSPLLTKTLLKLELIREKNKTPKEVEPEEVPEDTEENTEVPVADELPDPEPVEDVLVIASDEDDEYHEEEDDVNIIIETEEIKVPEGISLDGFAKKNKRKRRNQKQPKKYIYTKIQALHDTVVSTTSFIPKHELLDNFYKMYVKKGGKRDTFGMMNTFNIYFPILTLFGIIEVKGRRVRYGMIKEEVVVEEVIETQTENITENED